MAGYLTNLVAKTNLLRWFESQKISVDGSTFGGWNDSAGSGYGLLPPTVGAEPTWNQYAFKSWSAVDLAGTEGISDSFGILPAPNVTVKDLFIVAQYEDAAFSGYNSLLAPLLVGTNGATKFANPSPTVAVYALNGQGFSATNMQAPMQRFALIRLSIAAGYSMAFGFGPWTGQIVEALAFSAVLSGDAERAIKLFFNIKYQLFRRNSYMPLEFPDPSITGIRYARYYEVPTDWDEVTIKHIYDDESATFSDTTDTPPKKWEVAFTGLTTDEADIFDAFYESARKKNPFSFRDKGNTIWEGVRVESYERNHEGHKSWNNSVSFVLVKYYN